MADTEEKKHWVFRVHVADRAGALTSIASAFSNRGISIDTVVGHGHVLTPGRYVGAEAAEEDAEPFDDKMRRMVATLREQQAEAARLDELINANLREFGYGE